MSGAVLALMQAKRACLWASGLSAGLVSTLALVALVRHAVDVDSLGAPLDSVMAAYAAKTQLAFGWADPYLQMLVASVSGYLNLHLTLHPYWKDAFVLFGVYGAGYACACLFSDESKFGLKLVVRQIMLAIAVFFAAMVVGVLPLRSDNEITQIAIFSLPVAMYSFSFTYWHDYIQTLLSTFYLVSAAALLAWLIGDAFGFVGALGFWCLALWVLSNGLNLIFEGLISNEHRYAWVRVGLVIVGGFIGAACFFAIEASLKFLAA
jgi:hypothetical protein